MKIVPKMPLAACQLSRRRNYFISPHTQTNKLTTKKISLKVVTLHRLPQTKRQHCDAQI